MTDWELNRRYTPPPEAPASWFYDALGEVRQQRVGDVRVGFELLGGGGEIVGLLEGVGEIPMGQHGGIEVLVDGQCEGIPCEDLEAFTLLDDGPIDASDELRAGS